MTTMRILLKRQLNRNCTKGHRRRNMNEKNETDVRGRQFDGRGKDRLNGTEIEVDVSTDAVRKIGTEIVENVMTAIEPDIGTETTTGTEIMDDETITTAKNVIDAKKNATEAIESMATIMMTETDVGTSSAFHFHCKKKEEKKMIKKKSAPKFNIFTQKKNEFQSTRTLPFIFSKSPKFSEIRAVQNENARQLHWCVSSPNTHPAHADIETKEPLLLTFEMETIFICVSTAVEPCTLQFRLRLSSHVYDGQ